MREDIIKEMNSQLDRLSSPGQRIFALMLNNAERLLEFQLESAQRYAHLNFLQLRDMLQVRDPQSLQTYLENQNRYASQYSRCLSEDAENLADIGRDFTSQAQKVAQQNMTSLTEAARRAGSRLEQAGQQAAGAQARGERRHSA